MSDELLALVAFTSPLQALLAAFGCVGIVGSFVYFPLRVFSHKRPWWQRLLCFVLAALGIIGFLMIVEFATQYEGGKGFLQTDAFAWFAIMGFTTLLVGIPMERWAARQARRERALRAELHAIRRRSRRALAAAAGSAAQKAKAASAAGKSLPAAQAPVTAPGVSAPMRPAPPPASK